MRAAFRKGEKRNRSGLHSAAVLILTDGCFGFRFAPQELPLTCAWNAGRRAQSGFVEV